MKSTLFGGEVIIPKNILHDPQRVLRIVENTLSARATDVKVDFRVTTKTWEHQPQFLIAAKQGERIIYTTDKIYMFMDVGTKPHIIRAKPRIGWTGRWTRGALHFFAIGFKPKTLPRVIGSGAGAVATQGEQFRSMVHHPGTAAREYCQVIAEKWRKELPIILQRAIDAEVARP